MVCHSANISFGTKLFEHGRVIRDRNKGKAAGSRRH